MPIATGIGVRPARTNFVLIARSEFPCCLLVSQQNADGFAFRIAGDHVNFTVSVYIPHGHSPCSLARRERRMGYCFEAAASVTEHDANSITCRSNHVRPAI